MGVLLDGYLSFLIFLFVSILVAGFLAILSFRFGKGGQEREGTSTSECGFSAFDEAHMGFDVRSCLIAVFFLILLVAILLLFPWAVAFRPIGLSGYLSMMFFLGVLAVGFVYAWTKGALEWD